MANGASFQLNLGSKFNCHPLGKGRSAYIVSYWQTKISNYRKHSPAWLIFKCAPINFPTFVNYCNNFLNVFVCLALTSSFLSIPPPLYLPYIQGCKLVSNVSICQASLGRLRKVDLSISNHSKAIIKMWDDCLGLRGAIRCLCSQTWEHCTWFLKNFTEFA